MPTKDELTISYGTQYATAKVVHIMDPGQPSDAMDWCLYRQPGLKSHGGMMRHHPELSNLDTDVWTVRSNHPVHGENIFYLTVKHTLWPKE